MPKLNRGNTTKLSIRLSAIAKGKIEAAAKNLGISQAGVILFELGQILKNPPTETKLQTIVSAVTLENAHFVMTVNQNIMQRVNELAEDYDMKKNVLVGYLISDLFENMEVREETDLEPKQLLVQVNEDLKKRIMEYSENHYIPLNSIVSYSILKGHYEKLPYFSGNQLEQFFTNVPAYIGDKVKRKSEEFDMREHFYTAMCLYKQFMTPEGRFFETRKGTD